jgi:hypothetical protein
LIRADRDTSKWDPHSGDNYFSEWHSVWERLAL